MKANKNVVIRKVMDEYIIIPTGEYADRLQGMITLNSTGAFVLELLQNDCTEGEIAKALSTEYDVDYDTAFEDIKEILGNMEKLGLLEK